MRIIILIALFLSLSMVGYSSEPEQLSDSIVDLIGDAEKGDADAQYHLGVCYHNGYGVEKDPEKAVFWYTKAAEQGDAKAQKSLGKFIAEGLGVLQDYVLAHKWLNIASSLGREDAREARKELEAHMTPDQIAEAQKLARDWIANRKQQGE